MISQTVTLWRRFAACLGAVVAMAAVFPGPALADEKTPPYWASLSVNEARMRVGPSPDYPANWVYRRHDLPVRVVQRHGNWRKVADPSGTQGWMHVRLLSDEPTAIVRPSAPAMMHAGRGDDTPLLFEAESGVVGRVDDCKGGWCAFNVGGRRGFVRASSLWGAVD